MRWGVVAVAALALAVPAHGASPFGWRGVVEGAYGPTWDHAARSRVLAWMPRHGFDAYVHAPKDDLYQRTLWRDAYPPAQQAEFDAEIGFAKAHGVQWIPNLSPALPELPTPRLPGSAPSAPICFSCAADLDAVLAKLEPFRRAGARTFMISFDDVVKGFAHPEDVARYGAGDEAYGRANGDFLTRLLAALRARSADARLLTVGADYSGTSDTAYLGGLRSTLAPEVGVMWTGVGIPSAPFSPGDARAYGRLIGRVPLVWDNWTDNDTAGNATPLGTARVFLGPYERRADVAGSVGGFFLNPMNEADLNLLPLATAGDWLQDPARYDPRRSWLRAVDGFGGPRLRSPLRAWSETSYSTKLDSHEAPTFVHLSGAFLTAYRGGPWWAVPYSRLGAELALTGAARERLGALADHAFRDQAAPFLDAAAQAAGAGALGTRLLAAERPALRVARRGSGFAGVARPPDPQRASELRSRYTSEERSARLSRRFVYGWRGGVAFDVPPSSAPPNVLDTYFSAIDALDGAWQQHASDAARSVTLTLAGQPVQLAPGGGFRLGESACGKRLVATDGAGGTTGVVLARCP